MAGLTDEHYRGWKEGRITLDHVAVQLGVSKMAVSKAFRRKKPAQCSASPSAASHAPSPAPLCSTGAGTALTPPLPGAKGIVHEFTEDNIVALAGSAAFGILARANFLVVSDLDLGASQVKATATALSAALDTLQRLGMVTFKAPEALPTELRIQVLSAEEERQIRKARETEE